jgi:hypothetical protein
MHGFQVHRGSGIVEVNLALFSKVYLGLILKRRSIFQTRVTRALTSLGSLIASSTPKQR